MTSPVNLDSGTAATVRPIGPGENLRHFFETRFIPEDRPKDCYLRRFRQALCLFELALDRPPVVSDLTAETMSAARARLTALHINGFSIRTFHQFVQRLWLFAAGRCASLDPPSMRRGPARRIKLKYRRGRVKLARRERAQGMTAETLWDCVNCRYAAAMHLPTYAPDVMQIRRAVSWFVRFLDRPAMTDDLCDEKISMAAVALSSRPDFSESDFRDAIGRLWMYLGTVGIVGTLPTAAREGGAL